MVTINTLPHGYNRQALRLSVRIEWWDWDIEKIEANFEALSSNDLSLIKDIKI